MLKKVEKLINNSAYYNHLRFNKLAVWMIELANNNISKNINFYNSFLKEQPNKLIFDIGANKGNKVIAFTKMGYKVIALEPEKYAIQTLEYRFKNNKNVTIVKKGVSNEEGELALHITDARSGLNTFSDKWVDSLQDNEENRWHNVNEFKETYTVPITTLDKLFEIYGVPYFIKIDVEGFEVNVIKGMKKVPKYLSFELNLPEFIEDAFEIINYLAAIHPKVKFQYSLNEKLESTKWLTTAEIIALLKTTPQRYFEIICNFED